MNNNYETKDFYLTAYLMATGFTLREHSKTAGLTVFRFEQTAELDRAIENYYRFTASVEPITYGNAMRTLKTFIHQNTNANEQFHSQSRKGI